MTHHDLYDILEVIFVEANVPRRIHLRKTVEVLHWIKGNDVLYRDVDINLKSITESPKDDVLESIISTMAQRTDDQESPSNDLFDGVCANWRSECHWIRRIYG